MTTSICKRTPSLVDKAIDVRGSITVERLDKPPFTIKHGDPVAVWFSKNKWQQGTVVGISHVKKEVRVVFPGSVRSNGVWFAVGAIYPPDYPEAQGPKGKTPIVKISGKCGDKAESCTFTLKRQQKSIKAKGIDEALAAVDRLSKPCPCADLKQEPQLKPIEGSLLNSMVEEYQAQKAYEARGGEAARAGDLETAQLYKHVAGEEAQHYDEFAKRLESKEGTGMEQSAKMEICPACLLLARNKPKCSPAQAKKREACIQDMKATNREKGCKPEGTGSKKCPNPFAVCTATIGCRLPHNIATVSSNKFRMGQLVFTAGVNNRVADSAEFAKFVIASLRRHANADWGDLGAEDKAQNDEAVKTGQDRIFSAYEHGPPSNLKIWIITEWDRSVTTVLFPDEY